MLLGDSLVTGDVMGFAGGGSGLACFMMVGEKGKRGRQRVADEFIYAPVAILTT